MLPGIGSRPVSFWSAATRLSAPNSRNLEAWLSSTCARFDAAATPSTVMPSEPLRRCPYCHRQFLWLGDEDREDRADDPNVAPGPLPDDDGDRRHAPDVADFSRALTVTLIVAMVGCAIAVIAWHQDMGSILAAGLLIALAVGTGRARRRPGR